MQKQTTLVAALASVLATKGETPMAANDAQGNKVKLTLAQRAYNKAKEDVELYFDDPAQQAAVAAYVLKTMELRKTAGSVQQACWAGVASIFPNPEVAPTWHQIEAMKRSIGIQATGDWVYQQTIIGLRRLQSLGATYNDKGELLELGAVPKRNGGSKKGKREKSVARYQTNTAKDLQAMRKRMTEYKKVIDPAALKLYAEAFRLLGEAIKADRKAS